MSAERDPRPRGSSQATTRRTLLGAATALVPAACVGPRPGATAQPTAADVPVARRNGTPAPDREALLAQMTLDEKVGQMTQIDKNAATLGNGHEINQYFLGSVLNVGDAPYAPLYEYGFGLSW